ncbi:helix-turn-helix domain-containing protein [Paenibacillus sp. EC2-1]|uniref:helix-turn-helix domain-containing protein n=1 Tax=Paenibacillus sp. EC2-1 TaxID=3388665 RepID=UPI003BEF462B
MLDNTHTPERLRNEHFLNMPSPFRIFQHEIDHPIPTHWHEFFELAFVVSGEGKHVMNGITQPIRRGSCFLLTPADFHAIIPTRGQTIQLYDVIFLEQFIREQVIDLLFEGRTQYVHTFNIGEADLIEQEYIRLWEESENPQKGGELIRQGGLERILIDLARKCPTLSASISKYPMEQDNNQMNPLIRKALLYIHHHFREPLTLRETAEVCGLSANYFSECFRKYTGFTFQSYVLNQRLLFAKALLQTTKLPVTEICYASGFNTIAHFERAFKKSFDLCPRDVRKG